MTLMKRALVTVTADRRSAQHLEVAAGREEADCVRITAAMMSSSGWRHLTPDTQKSLLKSAEQLARTLNGVFDL